MEKFLIEQVEKETPLIDFDFEKGVLVIEGYSMPADPVVFYRPVIEKVKEYLATSPESIIFEMKLVYFNTASSKRLLDLMNLFLEGTIIKWYYSEDDEEMMEAGEEYANILEDRNVQFEIIKIP